MSRTSREVMLRSAGCVAQDGSCRVLLLLSW